MTSNPFEFYTKLFDKAMKGIYSAPRGMEDIRLWLEDYYGKYKNEHFNLDQTVFYMEKYNGEEYWLGVSPWVKNMSPYHRIRTFHDMCDVRCVIVPPVSFENNPLRYCEVLSETIDAFNRVSARYAAYRLIPFYCVVRHVYQRYGKDIIHDSEFMDAVFSPVYHPMAEMKGFADVQTWKDFILEDSKHLNLFSYSNGFPSLAMLVGTPDRFFYFKKERYDGGDDEEEDND